MSRSVLARLPLSRHDVDRDAATRADPELFEKLAADPATRYLVLWQGKALLAARTAGAPAETALALLTAAEAPEAQQRVYLGRSLTAGAEEHVATPYVALDLADAAASALESDESRWVNLRLVATELSDRDAGLFTEALAILNWHASHGFSPRNGSPTVVEMGGWVRRSPVDNSEVFPRTDPAIIVAILDADDRLLLGSNAMWESNRFSLLAGFVEPGESLEAAVVREVFEESGMRVVDPVYLGSQPWPFPASLMLGFRAQLAHDQDAIELRPDGEEILELRWFTREQLRREADDILLPGPSSIARSIIDDWLNDGD
ncbi:NAD(+) diphosphatase [Compostimonas suwonensis]|uniref:NAD(+) diphosphatase n=1 Tax=Compostimonas suwonensis TaxID=1048394 RepID=A0A2M9BWI2_9MICO|nr:NAD(+) diphosphatase [Compostimonas suwonensis]PJJ62284.1 NAD+ diphosphatase [Compostimonas suwonensis]